MERGKLAPLQNLAASLNSQLIPNQLARRVSQERREPAADDVRFVLLGLQMSHT